MIYLNQISTNLISPKTTNSIANSYYEEIWNVHKKDGYIKPEHFWEIPLWITRVSAILKKNKHPHNLNIITDIKKPLSKGLHMFSVLDVNKHIIKKIIKDNPNKTFILGGYIEGRKYFKSFNNVTYYNSLEELCFGNRWIMSKQFNYTLFKDYETIPRLQLSTGCKYRCKFCTVPNKVLKVTKETILKQVEQFKVLKFKLVYIDDKTFGQAENYLMLTELYYKIKQYNKNFNGFIIQTTANKVARLDFRDIHVFAAEIGVESFNNDILKAYNKPVNELAITTALAVLKHKKIKLIPNLIIGFPEETKETYSNTLKLIEFFKKSIYFANVYNLAIYEKAEVSNTIKIKKDADRNENIITKSYNSHKKTQLDIQYNNTLFSLLMQNLK